ncbi:LysR family transcriptional regulator [Deefgea tanakiae]|uniref:LysR family transcriptional regulator n=1 Tax=Deefgea tanakiae TaxID=2865840 RepID=A0ABX8Z856_9NEIS|nr:LysR family transcriptional regulator [Deefgea tanakiae]QZA78497.1 LysR family transcriptional regulator [Deefgea tanakiae]
MFNSIDALSAFVQAAELGSFSAAARHLGKSQSTISEAISNLEVDAGLALFDRTARQIKLTPAGVQLLNHARQVLNSHDALKRQASALHAGLEAQLSIVMSDTFQSREFESLLSEFAERFPLLRLECLADEDQDVLHLLHTGRAHLGLIRAQASYGADFSALPIPGRREMAIYVSQQHPLAKIENPSVAMLAEHRELVLSSYMENSNAQYSPRCWLAPSYLMLLEMTLRGFGWAALPTWQAEYFGQNQLVQLKLPNWPRNVQVDVIWSRHAILGPACSWLIDHISQTG